MALTRFFGPILAGVAVYFAAKTFLVDSGRPVSPEVIERELMASPAAEAVSILRERAPEDHARVITAFADALNRRSGPDEASDALQQSMAEVVRERAPDLRRAPQRSVVHVIESQLAILEALRGDPVTCGRVALRGPREIGPARRSELAPEAAEAEAAVLAALYEGRDSTAPEIAQPSELDYTEVIEGWTSRGATRDQVRLILAPSYTNPEFCAAAIDFLTYLSRSESMSAKRVRTDLVVSMLQG